MANGSSDSPTFGGRWTREKLNILRNYLNAYTADPQNTSFRLVYVDAFAGSGEISLPDKEPPVEGIFASFFGEEERAKENFLEGSVKIALAVNEKPFDELIFIEKNRKRFRSLQRLRDEHKDRCIRIENADANEILRNLKSEDWKRRRGVLFLDPFATQVEWRTLEAIAELKALDTWILFPASAIIRMLPTIRRLRDSLRSLEPKLNQVFGDESWRTLYQEQPGLLENYYERDSGVKSLVKLYKKKLEKLFGDRFLITSRTLRGPRNMPLFELLFCAGNPRNAETAKNTADHILNHL